MVWDQRQADMNNEITARILTQEENGKNEGEVTVNCPAGTILSTLIPHFAPSSLPLAAVKVNSKILPLSATLEVNALLEPVPLESQEGVAIYRCSLAFLLAVAARDLFPDRSLYIGHSLGHSFYYTFNEGKVPEKSEIKELERRMYDL